MDGILKIKLICQQNLYRGPILFNQSSSAAQTGVGISPTGPVEGTWVVGFYRDGEQAQEPVFFGTLGGIPEVPGEINVGFNDPRADTIEFHPDLSDKGLTRKKTLGIN